MLFEGGSDRVAPFQRLVEGSVRWMEMERHHLSVIQSPPRHCKSRAFATSLRNGNLPIPSFQIQCRDILCVSQPLQNVCNSGQRVRVKSKVDSKSHFAWFLSHKYNGSSMGTSWAFFPIVLQQLANLFDGFLIAHGDRMLGDMWYARQSFELGQYLSKKLAYPWF